MTTITINEPTSGMSTILADGSAVVTTTFPPCPVCQHNSKSTGGCYHCKPVGGACLPCVFRIEAPVGTDPGGSPINPTPIMPGVPPVTP
jgi:hypothetical protein